MLTFKMDASDFRKRGKEMVDYIADYMETISNRRVTPDVEPGYLAEKLPKKAPKKGEEFNDIMIDVDKYIIPGITHWQHPHFHAFFPAGNSFPSILGDMLSDAIGCVGFSWAASPACTELEIVVLDWFGKMLGLPNEFLHEGGTGGGVIQGSASECVLVTLLAARHTTLKDLKGRFPFVDDGILLPKLVAYSSKLAHSCVEKAGMIGLVKMRQLDVDEHFSLRGHVLERAIEEDRRLGLIPFYVCATLGTTACCSFDHLQELSEVCAKESVWLHVDAAYAGNALICAENQHYIRGIENATSFNCNPNKWMLVNFDCSLMWVRNKELLTSSMAVDPLYLQHKHDVALSGQITRMYTTLQIRFQLKGKRYYYIFPALGWPFVYPRQVKEVKLVALLLNHWGIPLSRRFRSLKIWFVIRTYGVEGLQHYIRKHIRLAKLFETYVKNDARFEVMGKVTMGLVCFRLKGPNSLTQKLCRMINESARLYTVPALINENYVIRFCVCAQDAMESDIEYAWRIISQEASELLDQRASIESNIEAEKNDRPEEVENNGEFDDVFPDFDDEIIFDQQRSNLQRARIRRNLFMRMVSDPKCYNPKVLRALNTDKPRHKSESDGEK